MLLMRLPDSMNPTMIAFGGNEFQFDIKWFAMVDGSLHGLLNNRPGLRGVES
jgi:hypothetical protein